MLALEDHIEKAIRGQLEDLKDYPDVISELRQIHRKVEHHISDLRGLSEGRQAGGVKETVKRAGSAVLGAAAGVIDLVRTEGLPKNLRDDYTRSEEHTSELQSLAYLVCRLLLEKKNKTRLGASSQAIRKGSRVSAQDLRRSGARRVSQQGVHGRAVSAGHSPEPLSLA